MSLNLFMSTPAGSLAKVSEENKRNAYVQRMFTLPKQVRDTATSVKVAAYLRGLTKSHNLPEDASITIAFIILQGLIGERMLAQMPMQLSSDLGIANDKAQRIAQEIERDIFAPISLQLNQFLATQRQQKNSVTGSITATPPAPRQPNQNARFSRTPASPPNILNLKNNPRPPSPPPIPKKNDSTIF